MGFPQFVEIYMEDMKPRLKLNTFLTKKHIIDSKIILYFAKKSLAAVSATDVIQWQNQLLSMRDENDRPYSRVIELPEFLCRELEDYFGMHYRSDRLRSEA